MLFGFLIPLIKLHTINISSNINEVIRDNVRSFLQKDFTHKKAHKMQTSDFHADTFIGL